MQNKLFTSLIVVSLLFVCMQNASASDNASLENRGKKSESIETINKKLSPIERISRGLGSATLLFASGACGYSVREHARKESFRHVLTCPVSYVTSIIIANSLWNAWILAQQAKNGRP